MTHDRFVQNLEGLRIFRPGVGDITEQLRWRAAVDELIRFWSHLGDANIHPDDASILNSADFATDLAPVPWAGPLRSAKIYFLFLNPGLSENDRMEESRAAFKAAVRANLSGDGPYFYLLKEHSSHPGHRWARQTFGADVTEAAAAEICVLQLVSYHSKENRVAKKAAPKLPSTIAIRRFVQNGLLPRVRAGDAALVVARSERLWGVEIEEPRIIVYRGGERRRAFQTKGSRGGVLMRQILTLT